MRIFHSSRRQAGDTIIEVMIAISVIATVLVGAYYVASNSTRTVRDNQERAQAQQYLQGQVEDLRNYLSNVRQSEIGMIDGQKYCIVNGEVHALQGDNCHPESGNDSVNYQLSLVKTGDLYRLNVTWDGIKGKQATQDFTYRVYPADGVAATPPGTPPADANPPDDGNPPADPPTVTCPNDGLTILYDGYCIFPEAAPAGTYCPAYAPILYRGECWVPVPSLEEMN